MASEWQQLTLGDLIDEKKAFIQTGPFGSQLHASDYTTNGVKVIPTEAIGKGRILGIPLPQINLDKAVELKRHSLRSGDILFARRGIQATGLSALVDEEYEGAICGTGAILLRILSKDIDPVFLSLYLNSNTIFSWLRANAVGAVMPNLNAAVLRSIPLHLPHINEQKNIASFLTSINNKLEVNRKMNATLEQMAQALFKSWFVDFDPVKTKAAGRQPSGMDAETAALFPRKFEEAEIGLIPQGWQAISLDSAYEIFDSKRIPLSSNQRAVRKGIYPYYGAASVMDYIDDFLFDGIYLLVGEDGSVIQSNGTPVLQYVWGRFWVNNHAHVLRGRGAISTEHLMLALKRQNIAAFVTGAVQPKLNQSNLGRIPFLKPSDEIAKAFASYIAPLFEMFRTNVEQDITLSKLRDSLLPKLISGQLPLASA